VIYAGLNSVRVSVNVLLINWFKELLPKIFAVSVILVESLNVLQSSIRKYSSHLQPHDNRRMTHCNNRFCIFYICFVYSREFSWTVFRNWKGIAGRIYRSGKRHNSLPKEWYSWWNFLNCFWFLQIVIPFVKHFLSKLTVNP